MNRIDKFEQKHFRLRPEYRVIGELMNRLKVSEGKEKFLLQQKINRALRMVQWREAYDPNEPENYGTIQHDQVGPSEDLLEHAGFEKEKGVIEGADDDDDIEFDDMKEKDDILLEKLNAIDRKLEEKLAELDHTFGKKGKLLEEEIRDLAEERNSLTEKKRRPLYRKVSTNSYPVHLDLDKSLTNFLVSEFGLLSIPLHGMHYFVIILKMSYILKTAVRFDQQCYKHSELDLNFDLSCFIVSEIFLAV